MTRRINRIEHDGIITSVSEGILVVSILQQSACLSCAVKGACNTAESENKDIEVTRFNGQFELDERVNVYYERSLGFKALLLGYVLPFILLLLVLVIGDQIFNNEGIAGIVSLCSLVPYYGVLFFMRDKLREEFSFRVEKLNDQKYMKNNALEQVRNSMG